MFSRLHHSIFIFASNSVPQKEESDQQQTPCADISLTELLSVFVQFFSLDFPTALARLPRFCAAQFSRQSCFVCLKVYMLFDFRPDSSAVFHSQVVYEARKLIRETPRLSTATEIRFEAPNEKVIRVNR
jgi:hypothetical protein